MSIGADTKKVNFAESFARNEERVAVLNSGCRLDRDKIKELDFSTLAQLQFNTTNKLDLDEKFIFKENRAQIRKEQLHKFQLVDLFRMKQEWLRY